MKKDDGIYLLEEGLKTKFGVSDILTFDKNKKTLTVVRSWGANSTKLTFWKDEDGKSVDELFIAGNGIDENQFLKNLCSDGYLATVTKNDTVEILCVNLVQGKNYERIEAGRP